GSCALCLANVANGKMDAYWEVFTKPWDALAGYLLVKEAGGQTNDFESNLFENQGNLIIAASPELFGKIVKLF
ncbi:MAG: inositol monophosphatase family protein, partial [Planktomarina sp.]|nr:inositol monophosphatase family protein [Planktomarina sp.]